MQILSANNNGTLHLCRLDGSGKDAAADGDVSGEWTLLVNVCALYCLFGGFEAKANIFVVAFDDAVAKDDAL